MLYIVLTSVVSQILSVWFHWYASAERVIRDGKVRNGNVKLGENFREPRRRRRSRKRNFTNELV